MLPLSLLFVQKCSSYPVVHFKKKAQGILAGQLGEPYMKIYLSPVLIVRKKMNYYSSHSSMKRLPVSGNMWTDIRGCVS